MNIIDPKLAAARRKRLGQFFSGVKLGRLLAGLTAATTAQSIIDPMVGSGDLLQGCLDLGATPELLTGIEIDEAAAQQAKSRLASADIIRGDAFDPQTLSSLPTLGYDLVIGNPPFVRYQEGRAADHGLPDAASVRGNLEASLHLFEHQDRTALTTYRNIIASYSGLADLAVPACILSMLLVRPGGEIALVLPQAWLSRDYALPVRHAMETLFNVVAVVEDDSASWFDEASVRTALIVAHRSHPSVPNRSPMRNPVHVRLKADAADERSLVGRLAPGVSTPEIVVGDMLRRADERLTTGNSKRHLSVRLLTGLTHHLRSGPTPSSSDILPPEMQDVLSGNTVRLVGLSDFKVSAFQGLRTGANDFFYVEAAEDLASCRTSTTLGGTVLDDVGGLLRPAVRDQAAHAANAASEPRARRVDAILDLRSVALREDLARSGDLTRMAYRPMPDQLARHVRAAVSVKTGKPGRLRPIPDLSAVSTNARSERPGRPARFWYQLPDFQARHLPDVFMPRVNAGRPRAHVNANRHALVDANFITFRCSEGIAPATLAAMLNSVWTWAYLELVGTVLGGGALKIEAAMLQRLPWPSLSVSELRDLERVAASSPDSVELETALTTICCIDHSFTEPLRDVAGLRLAARCRKQRRRTTA